MAEMSADTQAIIDTLIEQGRLLRNDGRTNSIKTVNIKLDKFHGAFTAMNGFLSQIAASMNTMVGNGTTTGGSFNEGSATASAAARIEAAFEEGSEEREALLADVRDQLRRQADLDAAALTRAEEAEKEKQEQEKKDRLKKQGEENLKALKENTVTGQLLTNPVSFLTKVLKGALIGFVGFNIIRGVVDAWTGGAMTDFIEGIDWEAIGKNFKDLAEWLGSNKWAAFTAVLSSWLLVDFGVPLAVNLVGEALRTNALVTALAKMSGAEIKSAPGFLSTTNVLKAGLLGLLAIGFRFAADKIRDSLRFDGMTEEQILRAEAVGYDTTASAAVNIAGYTAAGASLGRIFGPKGMIVGAILGFAIGAGMKVWEVVNRKSQEKIDVALLEEEVAIQQAEANKKAAEDLLAQVAAEQITVSDAQLRSLRLQAGLNPETGEPLIDGPEISPELQELINDTNEEIANAVAREQAKLNRLQDQLDDPYLRYKEGVGPNSIGTWEEITDASEIAKIQAERQAKFEAQQKYFQEIIAMRDERIASGVDAEDLVAIAPVGIWETIADLWEDNRDRRLRRDREKEEEAFEEFQKSYEGPANRRVLQQALDAIEEGTLTSQQAITIIRQGDSQVVDNKDVSTSTYNSFDMSGYEAALLPNG